MALDIKNILSKNLKVDYEKIVIKGFEEEEEKEVSSNYPKLREWDHKLLSYFKPFYSPLCSLCCLCTYGKCDLSKNRKGGCGINLEKQQARIVLLACCMGAATHTSHARHLLEIALKKNPNLKLKTSRDIQVIAPITTTVTGVKPETVKDLAKILDMIEREITMLLAATHTGQEGDSIDFESKALHAGLLDNMAKEIGELIQISLYDLPFGEEDVHFVEIGLGTIEKEKPVILCIGHNIAPGAAIIDYLEELGIEDKVEVCGLCCTAIDISRYSKRAKIVGPLSRQLTFILSGTADVVVIDEQCIRNDVLEICSSMDIPVIATSEKASFGLPDLTDEEPDKIIRDLLTKKYPGALIRDEDKVGEVAVRLALILKEQKKRIGLDLRDKQVLESIKECTECGWCNRVCPAMLPIKEAMIEAKKGNLEPLSNIYEKCVGCGKCVEFCERNIKLVDLYRVAAKERIKNEKFKVRAGRGPVTDVEIRKVGAPIVFGDIPGVILFAGCDNYYNGNDLPLMAEEFLKRGYIVVATGCSSMAIAFYKDKDGKTLYEKYHGAFDRGGLLNLGPCLANAHAIGAAIKIANIFAKLPLEKNFPEVADYILNRIGVCAVAWGAMSQKAAAIATGANRWGIPVILGPHGSKYRRLYLGEEMLRKIKDRRTGELIDTEPAPLHLIYAAESLNEAIPLIAKLCIRPNDTPKGRLIKLTHYIDLSKKYLGYVPEDIHLYIRNEREIPYQYKEEVKKILKEKGWKPREAPKEPSIL
ncbi:CO dehydrogenase/acetyl-CoA synthase complex, epsilon subunit [Methanocaldococcus infernus ME]|uniref:Acetyl-CoA decarbonylase/synthase complex subunit alpha n=1 Tax=Methanocaldococcus infernus (strain DSM 11812 / JCM 15783 / ME) TaxID=573063 RepID=D5VSY5_METIM|nr:CO dehydrogenase/acetyl-CoA synthase complex subunit alpha [Methanocaldococcus infernus]ADG13688.1 CO dehydrogenase/acetyl-CoA synthase complex, epsilon subunit [Methanocaldococcus infernus ME]